MRRVRSGIVRDKTTFYFSCKNLEGGKVLCTVEAASRWSFTQNLLSYFTTQRVDLVNPDSESISTNASLVATTEARYVDLKSLVLSVYRDNFVDSHRGKKGAEQSQTITLSSDVATITYFRPWIWSWPARI
ncbi:hypothetical protein ACRALDRAFT_208233 [Sodiomyces alcalophilus JCM 7366]|uniref:uncharacterized protein n=1 Tax=Sodiomyces alcalophilus JCM 7366 TaxID=591952 RepID=UPI0039B414B9